MFKRGCPRFNSQHNWGDAYDPLMSTRIFTLIMNRMPIYMSSENLEESGFILDMLIISYLLCVSNPRRSGLDGRSNHSRPINLNLTSTENKRVVDVFFSSA